MDLEFHNKKSMFCQSVPNIKSQYENKPNRDLVLWDQKVLPEVRNRQLLHRDFPAIQPSEIPHEILLGIPLELSLEIYLEMRFEIPLEISLEIFLKYFLEYLSNYLLTYLLKFPFEIPSEIPLELSLEIHLEIRLEIPSAIRAEMLLAILHHNKTHPQPPYQALAWSYR